MKKIILLFITLVSVSTFAQKQIDEGVITLKMKMSTDNPQAKAMFDMMGDINVTTYFKGQKSRTEQSHQMTGDNTSIVDNEAKKMLVLMSNPMAGKKYLKQDIKTSEDDLKNVTVTENGESKTIAGYSCKGYNVTVNKDGIEVKMVMYVTDKIIAPTQNTAGLGSKLKGFPMYMVANTKQGPIDMKIIMEVTGVKEEKVADNKFNMTVPEGYTKLEKPKPVSVD